MLKMCSHLEGGGAVFVPLHDSVAKEGVTFFFHDRVHGIGVVFFLGEFFGGQDESS